VRSPSLSFDRAGAPTIVNCGRDGVDRGFVAGCLERSLLIGALAAKPGVYSSVGRALGF